MRYVAILSVIFSTVFLSNAQEATVVFNVLMHHQVDIGNFDPDEDFVDVAGTFNGWGDQLTQLSDPDGDTVYTVELSDFTVGQSIQFKFRINGAWNGLEEFPGGGPNRQYTVMSERDTLQVWYSDIPSNSGPPVADFTALPAQAQTGSQVRFRNLSSGTVEYYEWTFEGGIPESSTEYEPIVTYLHAGAYDVQLIVGNADSRDTLLIEDHVHVAPRDISHLDWWNESVFYEMFVRSFKDSDGDGVGDFRGAIEKLDYLNDGNPDTDDDLGITGIWLMPINPSPTYHGYDVQDYRGINPDYGTMEDFRAFLDSCHARGIRVIMDYVMNHSSSQHQWFLDALNNQNDKRNYYRWSSTNPGYEGPWGQNVWHFRNGAYYYGIFWSEMPDLNYNEPEVRQEMLDIATYWLEDVGVDGFRIDAAKYLYEDGSNLENLPQTIEFYQDLNTSTKAVNPGSFSVGEVWDDISVILPYVEDDGIDYCFEFGLAGNMLYAANTGSTESLRDRISLVYNSYPHMQWGTFLTNHDQNRVMNELGGSDARHKLAAAIYLTLPGVPYIYYGEEVGMTGVKPDENIRRPMSWTGGSKAGFTTGTPWRGFATNQQTHNVADQRGNSNSIFNRYKDLIQLRNQTPALQTGEYFSTAASEDALLSFVRTTEDDTVMVIINTSNQLIAEAQVDLTLTGVTPGMQSYRDLLRKQTEEFTIDDEGNLLLEFVEPYRVYILRADETSAANYLSAEVDELKVFPNPVSDELIINSECGNGGDLEITITDQLGRSVSVTQNVNYQDNITLDVDHLLPGIYFISVNTKACRQTARFVKQ